MALFGKPKKLTLDEILTAIDGLSAEDKEKVHVKMQDLYKAEDEREIDKIEEDKASNDEVKDEKAEEVTEESEEIGKDVDEVEEEVEEPTETEEPVESEDEPEEVVEEETAVEEHEAEDQDKNNALLARLQSLEDENAKLSQKYDELYAMLEDREKNHNFGATPEVPEDEESEDYGKKDVYTAYAGRNAHKYY